MPAPLQVGTLLAFEVCNSSDVCQLDSPTAALFKIQRTSSQRRALERKRKVAELERQETRNHVKLPAVKQVPRSLQPYQK